MEQPLNAKYTQEELKQLTTLQLREICSKEKLVVGAAYKLDREYMTNLILKYRGARLRTFVENYIQKSYHSVTEMFPSLLNFIEDKHIMIPTRITLYKNMDLDGYNNYIVECEGFKESNLFLLSNERKICGILNIKEIDGKLFLHCKSELLDQEELEETLYKNYSLGFLSEKGSRYLYDYYYGHQLRRLKQNCYVVPIFELHIVSIQKAGTPLVIDFGTSNSSAGAYLNEHFIYGQVKWGLQRSGIDFNDINKVKFPNNSDGDSGNEQNEIIPTIMSIKSCGGPDGTVYRYGYDALHYNKRYGYNSPASVFHGIKRWVNDYNKTEGIADEEGNIAIVSRLEIITAYFKYIISLADSQHKCKYTTLHITSPVKQKQQFLEMYKAALPDYEIVVKTALDEGVAVLYNSISKQIENLRFEEREEYRALIIDCGGGTTDLTSSTYTIEDNQITYKLDLTTTYSNGETNFGGNNITYRIFQYLKIAFSKYYVHGEKICVEDVFDEDLQDVYRYVDENGHDSVYSKLEKQYKTCEDVIPTRYHDYRNVSAEDYMKVRSNFYFMWSLAEKIKIDFFQTYSVAQSSFHLYGLKDDPNDTKIVSEESWRLNIYKDTKSYTAHKNLTSIKRTMVLHTDLPNVVVTKEEVKMLIRADIYDLIKKFIEPIYYSEGLDQFHFIKLMGQTCKIDIFRDALKEFIPGRVIESARKEKTVNDFKLTCLEGAIKYQNARVIGLIAPDIVNNAPITPYKLTAYTHSGAEVTMISSLKELPQSYGFVSRNIDTENMELILRNADGKVLHKYPLNTSRRYFRPTDYNETTEMFSEKIPQDDIDSIADNEIKIFTYAYEDKWGFYVLPLARAAGTLFMGENKYLPFENDEWEVNFFDGEK